MLPSRYGVSQPSSTSIRKSRVEGKPSLLPKPRRPASTDRLSFEARRPSAPSRSSSADPARVTFAGGRLSREASSTKLPFHARSRSQQGDKHVLSSMTPQNSHYGRAPRTPRSRSEQGDKHVLSFMTPQNSHYGRARTTPRTPSEDRASRKWKTSLERALAFVTVKDQREITNVAWQRAQYSRIQEALNMRGGAGAAAMTLIRPLTITRFVEITGCLLKSIAKDVGLNTDNYVVKLPNIGKLLLYPGTLSKSWLKTVNALHSFPQALAFIAYLLDLVNEIEKPITEEDIYVENDELSRLKREYLNNCWIRFQESVPKFDDYTREYLEKLQQHLGNDEEKIKNLEEIIKRYEACLEDAEEVAARAEEARRVERRDATLAAWKAEKAALMQTEAEIEVQKAIKMDREQELKQLELEIERANAELDEVSKEVESQSMSVEERARLRADTDYKARVLESKRVMIEQVEMMVMKKEAELAHWQTISLAGCQEFNQGLIQLSAQYPDIASLAIDENELMHEECVRHVAHVVDVLKQKTQEMAEKRVKQMRKKTAESRKISIEVEELKAEVDTLKLAIEREQQLLEAEVSKEAAEAVAWSIEQQELLKKIEELESRQEEYAKVEADLQIWQNQEAAWRAKIEEMEEFIRHKREECKTLLETGRNTRKQILIKYIRKWNAKIASGTSAGPSTSSVKPFTSAKPSTSATSSGDNANQ